MIFSEIFLKGAFVIDLEPVVDERGLFARSWCKREFQQNSLPDEFVQCNISFNQKKGTLRGMHFQQAPYAEEKLVRCTKGFIYDVIIDLRPESDTFLKWYAVELSEKNRKSLFIPSGFAHGFQTLVDNSEVFYQMSEFYHPESGRGVRWNDPAFGIDWPEDTQNVSKKDQEYPDFQDQL